MTPKEVFSNLATDPGKPTQKAAISEKDSVASKVFEEVAKGKLRSGSAPLTQQVPESQYEKGFVYGEDPEVHFAQRQGKLAELGNASARVALNFVPGLLGSIGGIADIPDWFAGLNEQNEEVGNALTRWANQAKQTVNEDIAPIYQQNQTPGIHLGSSEWWFDKGSGVVESAAEFAALGFGLGSLLTKGLTAAKWLTAIDAATGGVKLNALGQAIGVGTNAFMLNQAESILDATQTYDDELKKNMELVKEGKLTEHEAKVNAAQSAAHVVNIDRINILLNLSSVGAIMRGSRGTRAIKSMMNPIQKTVLEGGQEYAEETVNYFAGQRAAEMGEAKRKGTEYTGPTFSKLMEDMTSAQGVEAGFLGMLGGIGQTGIVETAQAVRGTNKAEKDWIAQQQATLKSFDDLRKTKKLSNVADVVGNLEAHTRLTKYKEILEADIAASVAKGEEPATDKVVALAETEYNILAAQAQRNFAMGTTDYLEKAYQDIASLTDEQAKENGFTEDQLNPKSPSYFKTKAQNALSTIKTLEKAYLKAEGYMNAPVLFKIKANEHRQEHLLNIGRQKLAEKALEANQAISALSRKTLTAPGVNTSFTLEQIGEVETEQDFSRQAILKKAAELEPVKQYEKLRKNLIELEDELDLTRQMYAEQTSDKYQKELQARKKEEVKQKAEILKKIKTTEAKIKQAGTVKENKKSTVSAAVTVQDADSKELKANADDIQEIAIKAFEQGYENLLPDEKALVAIPKNKALYDEFFKINTENKTEKAESKQDKLKAADVHNPPTTVTEVVQILGEVNKFADTTMDTELVGKQDTKGKLHQAYNVLAWLARVYTKVVSPSSMNKQVVDVNNQLNPNMIQPLILDNRYLDVGDTVTLQVQDGYTVLPDQNQDEIPIVVKKGDDVVAWLHVPDWIKDETTQANVAQNQMALRMLRKQVITKGKLSTKIKTRTYGKLSLRTDKTPVAVANAFKNQGIDYGMYFSGSFTNARTTEAYPQETIDKRKLAITIDNKKKIIVNRELMQEGRSYALVPIKHTKDNKPEEVWAIPMVAAKLSTDLKNTAVKAVEIFYKNTIDQVGITEEEQKIVDAIKAANRHITVGDSPVNFDITTAEGLNNFLSLFMYSKHRKEGMKGENVKASGEAADISLGDWLMQADVTSDYHAMEVSPHGVFFGWGGIGVVPRKGMELPAFLEAFSKFLEGVYTHTNLDRLGSQAVVSVIKPDNTVVSLNDKDYSAFLKQHVWRTNVLEHNISKDPSAPNYAYAVQQIIEIETDEFIKPVEKTAEKAIMTPEGEVITEKQASSAQMAALLAAATKKLGKPVPQGNLTDALEDADLPLENLPEESFVAIKDRYRIPGIKLEAQDSLINWIASVVNEAYEKQAKEGDGKYYQKFDTLLNTIKSQFEKLAAETSDPSHKFYKKLVEEWTAVARLAAYDLETNHGYKITTDDIAISEEAHALNPWSINSLEKDPTSSLTGKFRRFLATIDNPSKRSYIGTGFDKMNPNALYRHLSSILADTAPIFNVMIEKLEQHVKDLGDDAANSPIPEVIKALKGADEQIQTEFVVTASKHYVNMQHLYITPVYAASNHFLGYDGYVRNDNAAAKIAVTLEEWKTNLKMEGILTEPANDDAGTLMFNKENAKLLADEFLKLTPETFGDFDIDNWLRRVGITLHNNTLENIKKNGVRVSRKVTISNYEAMLSSKNSPFKLLAESLRDIALKEKPVVVENSPFMKDRFWRTLASADIAYSTVSHSYTHRSGDKYIFSYADNKYLTDRFKELQDNVNLLTQLADRSFSKHSWWLKGMLKTKVNTQGELVFERTEDGQVIPDLSKPLATKFALNYVSLQAMKERGVKESKIKALEDLSLLGHEKAKMMFFQNTGEVDPNTKERIGEFFLMTLSNKNTMLTVQSTIPKIGLDPDGNIDQDTTDLLFRNVVMPEMQRMWDYNDSHNINSYAEGSKLFYFFPSLNKLDLFNEDGSLKLDAGITYKAEIDKVIKATVKAEIDFKLNEWKNFNFVRHNSKGEVVGLKYFDRAYQGFVRSKLKGAKTTDAEVAYYAAAEMAVGYMVVNTNLFQLISTDPATQWKSKTNIDKVQQVKDTFDNITKRLGGEISPGKELAQRKGETYRLAVIQDVYVPSKVLDKVSKITGSDAYANINSTDAVEFITVEEKLRFMRQAGKLSPAQIKLIRSIEEKMVLYHKAVEDGEDPSQYDLDLKELGLIFQVDKPIMVGTRIDTGVETKLYVKSAAFTMIPQLLRGTELAKLEQLMHSEFIDRLAFSSAVKLGAPRNIAKVFDDKGNFIEGSTLGTNDIFEVDRKYLKLQQEVPVKDKTTIARVSQASKLLFVDIMDKTDFKLFNSNKTYSAVELHKIYNDTWHELYKTEYENLLTELGINPKFPGDWNPDLKALTAIINKELRKRNYPPQDLDSLGLEEIGTDTKTIRFKIAPWALAKSGKLEAFLNAIVDSRIVDQDMNGYSFVMASEVGFKFTKPDTEKRILTDLKDLKPAVQSEIVFTNSFDTELKPAAANNGYHQVVIPWKYKAALSDYVKDGKLDTKKFDTELLKAFGMRIPNQGPNSTAAIEIVGFLPPEAGDMIIAPADFVVQMGSDFDIDKLYVYLANHDKEQAKLGKLVKVRTDKEGKKAYLQNRVLDVHLSINTNMNPDIQKGITNPLESEELKNIANDIMKAEAKRVREYDVNMLSPISGSYQTNKYVNSTVASTAIGAFAVQNTFNALAQTVPDLKLVKSYLPDGEVIYSKIKFGKHIFNGETDFSAVETLDGKSKKSLLISALLSAAVDDEKMQVLSKIGINKQTISMANLLAQAGFDLETISYFLKQDSIQEYCKQISVLGSSQAALKAVLALPQFARVSKEYLDWVPGKRKPSGLTLEEQADPNFRPIAYEDITEDEEVAVPVRSKWGEMYNPSVATMKAQLALGEKAPNYADTQYAILKKFINLEKNEVKTLRKIQSLLNTDTKGPGKNMFESLTREETLENLAGSKLENALQLFGDFVNKQTLTSKEQNELKELGYIETNNTMFLPTSIPGFAMAYGVITNNRLWSKHFPYNDVAVRTFFKDISKELSEESRDYTEEADRNRRLFAQLKQYAFTDNHITAASVNETRRKLLYDFKDNLSLASIYQKLKEHPAIMSHKFLNNLFIVSKGENEPKVLLFKKPQDSEWSNFEIYSQVINSLKKPYKDPDTGEVVTWEFNGKKYNTRTLIEDIMLAARLSGTSALQQDMLQFLPVDYMVLKGTAEGINTYDWNGLYKGRTESTPSRAVIQYFQHYPQLTQAIEKISDIAYPNVVTVTPEKPEGMENAADKPEVVQFVLLPEKESSVFGRRLGDLPKFLHTANEEHLFILTDAENRVYTRISTLGTINNHEYNANTDFQTSNIAANNLPVPVSPVMSRVEHSQPEAPISGKLMSQKDYQDQLMMQAKYGIRAGEYHLKPEEITNLLNVIQAGDNVQNKELASFLLKVIPKFDIKMQSTRTFMAGSDLPSRGKAHINEDGSITVQINFPQIWNAESLELTVLHELAHAVTMGAILNPINASQEEAVGRLTNLFNRYKDKYYAGKEYEVLKDLHKNDPNFISLVYPTRNMKEFVVAALTQPEFRARLQSLKYDDNFTFWDKLKTIFKKLLKAFGIDLDSTAGKALQDILRLTEPPKGTVTKTVKKEPVPPAPEQDSYAGGKVFSAEAFKNAKKNPKLTKLMEMLKDIPEADPEDMADLPIEQIPVETPKGRYGKLIAEKKAHVKQLRKRIQELNIEKEETTGVKEKAEIEKRKDRVEKRIKELSVEIEAAESAVKLEDLIPLGLQELAEVSLELPKGLSLDYKDIEILNRKVQLWVNYSDNFLTDTEKLSESVAEKFKDVLAKAKNLEANLESIKRQKIFQLAERVTGRKLNAAEFYEATKDISEVASLTLSMDNADHALLQTVFEYIKQTETYSREEVLERTQAFQELLNNVKGKEAITGKNLENFISEDGTIIMPFTHEYFQTKHEFLHNAKAQEDAGEHAKAVETRKAFRKWIKENEIVFDIRKLMKIDGFEDMFTADAGKHEAELKNLIGESEYLRKLARAKRLYENYLADKQNEFTAIANSHVTDEEKALGQARWEEANNMFDYLDYRDDVANKFSNKGWRYVESTPRAVTADGKSTGWYSEKYKALRADPDVAALHDHVIELLVQLRRYLPESVARDFNINSLPALQKNLIETLKTEGMGAAVTHMWDGAKSKLSSGDLGNELYGASIDADRYLTVNIQTITSKIEKLYSQKRNDYMRINDLNDSTEITPEVDDRLRAEATAEVKKEHTLDLKAILGIYTTAVVDYRHKSRIEDAVRLAEDVFNNNIKEIKTNASDKPYLRITGKQKTVETTDSSPKNLRKMLAYTLDRFYRKPRLVEGKTDKKVYSSTENIRKKALEIELVTYEGELAAAEENGTEDQKTIAKGKISIVKAEIEKLGRVHTGTGWADALLQYIMVKGLGWNPFSGLTNLGFGTISNLTEAAGGQYFNEEQMLYGYKTVMSSVGKFWTVGTLGGDTALKVRTLMDNMDVFKRPSEEIYKDKAALTGVAESLHWAHIQNRTEYLNQAPVMVAMMSGYKLNKKDGTESNLWVAYGKDGKWDTENFGDIRKAFPLADRAKFQARVGEAIRKIHGNYDPNAPVRIKGTILGRMASVFRTWMFEGFNTRFEKESENYITGNKRKGRYRSYGGGSLVLAGAGLGTALLPGIGTGIGLAAGTALSTYFKKSDRYKDPNTSQFDELIAESKYLVRKMSLGLMFKQANLEDVFNSTDAQNMRKNMTELSLLMFVASVAMILRALKDDEDDEDVRNVLTYQLNVMHRLQQDIAFYAEPMSFFAILRDPIPATSTIEDTAKWFKAAAQYVNGEDVIPTGKYAGQSRLNRATGKLVPGWKQAVTTQDLLYQER